MSVSGVVDVCVQEHVYWSPTLTPVPPWTPGRILDVCPESCETQSHTVDYSLYDNTHSVRSSLSNSSKRHSPVVPQTDDTTTPLLATDVSNRRCPGPPGTCDPLTLLFRSRREDRVPPLPRRDRPPYDPCGTSPGPRLPPSIPLRRPGGTLQADPLRSPYTGLYLNSLFHTHVPFLYDPERTTEHRNLLWNKKTNIFSLPVRLGSVGRPTLVSGYPLLHPCFASSRTPPKVPRTESTEPFRCPL